MLIYGDCLDRLKELKANSVHSLVSDPPAGISFMGKDWDHHKGGRTEWIAWMASVMRECLRVMKPGAHGLVWALPRTSHWTATALEDAGFEIRDVVTHLFGSGFPKSLDVSKAIDKAAGAERKSIGFKKSPDGRDYALEDSAKAGLRDGTTFAVGQSLYKLSITAPATDAAKQWAGFGTALKPASEHWVLIRKPCSEKTVAANVLKWGTGAINVDASRVGTEVLPAQIAGQARIGTFERGHMLTPERTGRFPANLILDEEAAAMLDEQSGPCKTGNIKAGTLQGFGKGANTYGQGVVPREYATDNGSGASRFFYCAKASKKDKNAGLEGMPEIECGIGDDRPSGQSMSRLDGRKPRTAQNSHPTVKSTALMTYLIRMVTPPNGIVLDPFMGSGSTGVAAKSLGFKFIGIEREKEYFEIAKKRIENLELQTELL